MCTLSIARAEPERKAILVGVQQYTNLPSGARKLQGVGTDLKMMQIVLEYLGYKVQRLKDDEATKDDIQALLTKSAQDANAGDSVVFYFSGRGSLNVKENGATKDLEPTIVPSNGLANTGRNDLPISVLESFSSDLTQKGVSSCVILDCSFQRNQIAGRGESVFYERSPRLFARAGEVRKELWAGKGVFFCSSASGGEAYEWQRDPNTKLWSGAFTDMLCDTVIKKVQAGQKPSYKEVAGEVFSYFLALKPNYMPGIGPYPAAEQMNEAYDGPVFALSGVPTPTTTQKQEFKQQFDEIVETSQNLRLGVEIDPTISGNEREGLRKKYTEELDSYIKANLKDVVLVRQYSAGVDRVLVFGKKDGQATVQIVGDEVDNNEKLIFVGGTVQAIMESGPISLKGVLQKTAYVQQLFSLADLGRPTLTGDWSAKPQRNAFEPGDRIQFQIQAAASAAAYIFDRDASDGVVQFVFPLKEDLGNALKAGANALPNVEYKVYPDTPLGETLTRLLFVQDENGKAPAVWSLDGDGIKAELEHLQSLVQNLKSGKWKWASSTFRYSVVKKPQAR